MGAANVDAGKNAHYLWIARGHLARKRRLIDCVTELIQDRGDLENTVIGIRYGQATSSSKGFVIGEFDLNWTRVTVQVDGVAMAALVPTTSRAATDAPPNKFRMVLVITTS